MRILLIDDERNLAATVICRNGQEGIKALFFMGPWDCLMLDNDMGYESIQGVAVLDWLERPENKSFRPASVKVVTGNSVARSVMNVICSRLYNDYDAEYQIWSNLK